MKLIDGDSKPSATRGLFLRLLDRLFAYESMNGNGACPVYLERWTLLDLRRIQWAVYLHRFLGDDWALDPHDHPRRFISIGLWGWYWEDVFSIVRPHFAGEDGFFEPARPGKTQWRETIRHGAPWIRSFPAHHLHRIRASEHGNCWTLVIVLPKTRAWGFVRDGVWISVKDYVFGGKSRKAC